MISKALSKSNEPSFAIISRSKWLLQQQRGRGIHAAISVSRFNM